VALLLDRRGSLPGHVRLAIMALVKELVRRAMPDAARQPRIIVG
jgi:hypothetical protein